jgi:hypothetical protein
VSKPDCICEEPHRPKSQAFPPYICLTCGGFACEYADKGMTRCSPTICDCFIATHPDSPRDLHPEAYVVVTPTTEQEQP